jgi:hypothetical protein
MITAGAAVKKIPLTAWIIVAIVLVVLVAGGLYLNQPVKTTPMTGEASPVAKAYLPYLRLSDVAMQASENLMQQQVVEVQGKITNNGNRQLAAVEVYCLFYGTDNREIHRERLPLVRDLAARETRDFRLPFDSLPDGWNQAMPRLAIAKISFAN